MAELTKAIARLMEERDRVQQAPVAANDPPKLRDVLDLLRVKLAPGERPLADALTRQLFDRSLGDLVASATPAALAAIAQRIFRFVQEPAAAEPRVVIAAAADSPGGSDPLVLQTWMRNRPFIVDTVREELRQTGCNVLLFLHPIFTIERDPRGALLAVSADGDYGQHESVLYVEIDPVGDAEALTRRLHEALTRVMQATDDYAAMRNRAAEIADELRSNSLPRPWNADVDEIGAFLDWLSEKHFVFLGYREYQFSGQGAERSGAVRRGSGLGILRDEARSNFWEARPLSPLLRRRLSEPPLALFSKTNAESPIHRRAHMDYIGIKDVDAAGVVVGERRFVGLFTARAYAQEPITVPLLRMKLASVLEAHGAPPEDSHNYKQIAAVFRSLSRVELLALSAEQLHAVVSAILAAEGSNDIRVVQHPDPLGRGAFVVVMVPKSRFSNELSLQIEARLVDTLGARAVLERRLAIDDSDQVRLHFYFAPSGESVRSLPAEELRLQLCGLLRTWDDRLAEALVESMPRDQARDLARRYTAAFSPAYKSSTDVATAVRDIACLEGLLATRAAQIEVLNPEGVSERDPGRFSVLKLYLCSDDLVLSDFLPILENLGLRVFAQDPMDLTLPELGAVRIHSFFVLDARGARLDVERVGGLLKPAVLLLHRGRIDNDRLNSLILSAGLTWRQVDLLRTYAHHGAQIGTAPSREALVHALAAHPAPALALWRYFSARFDPLEPAAPRDREKNRLAELAEQFVAALDSVDSVVEDRMLRGVFDAMAATVRTNYFQTPDGGEPKPLAIKLDCRRLPKLPPPQPMYEIYVHALEVEGVHLRGAKVARGGIRLSDRPDDFRTEVLGLMSTQMVKNAVIVPAGAKGGFVVRRRPGTSPSAAQIVAAYRTFIATLLDLTDNLVAGRVETPAATLLYDDLDPYLVVAADKGTASFSDVANEIATQRKYWLGDAFASGGSNGYDHKKEGITARGAWECVKRHFRESGRDAEREPLTVAGIGDMSGDVFGNGLLLSRRFRLLAAFNHQHIFIDPDPDPSRSFSERERLFRLPRSSWADYGAAVLSEGGGIYARSAKRVPLSAAARALLGVGQREVSGDDVVRAILCLEVDLLWNGGIGTFVKAIEETHASVGDLGNDAVRIDGRDLRAQVVAEGGNLGFTQRGRVEYALHGGRLNSDAIDNSAGVDMSDHEVNLKICLAAAVESRLLTADERNRLLADLEPDVTQRVLSHNRRQARILSHDQWRSQSRLDLFRDHVSALEAAGFIDRRLAELPEREALRNRRATFLGLTRPELAVLLAHSKLALQHELLESSLPDDPYFEKYLRDYFPQAINERFGLAVRSHRLRREIIAVELANALIDSLGMTFAGRVARDSGQPTAAVARAWSIVAEVSRLNELWSEVVDADPPLPLAAEVACALAVEGGIERAIRWFLETQPANVPAAEMVQALTEPTAELLPLLQRVLPEPSRLQLAATVEGLAAEGTPRPLAERIVTLDRLAELFEIAEIAAGLEIDRPTVAAAFYRVGDLVDLDWLRQALKELPAEGRWERRATAELEQSLAASRRRLTSAILACGAGSGVEMCLERYAGANATRLAALGDLINDMKGARRPTLAALLVALRELSRLVEEPAAPE